MATSEKQPKIIYLAPHPVDSGRLTTNQPGSVRNEQNLDLEPDSQPVDEFAEQLAGQQLPPLDLLEVPVQQTSSPPSGEGSVDVQSAFIPLRDIVSNDVADSRRSVRNWGPSSKPANPLRTDFTTVAERDQRRVKLAMDLSAARSKFIAIYYREPTSEELAENLSSAFGAHAEKQFHAFQSPELKRSSEDYGYVKGDLHALESYLQTWIPKWLNIEEYTAASPIMHELYCPSEWRKHHSLVGGAQQAKPKEETHVAELRGEEALKILEKVSPYKSTLASDLFS
jgi:hypothetical protein